MDRKFTDDSLNKVPGNRPTFDALLKHPWLMPLSREREDFHVVEERHKKLLGRWVIDNMARQQRERSEREAGQRNPVKPPLHSIPLPSLTLEGLDVGSLLR